MIHKLRPYQENGINLMRKAFVDGNNKVLLFLATGGGKSVFFIKIVESLLKNKKKCCIVVKRKQLVFQTQKHFQNNGIYSSLMLNNQKGFDKDASLQICSIDTAQRRDTSYMDDFDFVIVDEAHDATSEKYREFLDSFNTKTKFIGLTATPFKVGKKIHNFWDCVVKPIEMHQLRELGYLVDATVFTPIEVDLKGIGTGADGDYNNKQLGQKMSELKVVGDVVENYKKYANGKRAICFCVNKDHSMTTNELFNNAGIQSIHCDESTPQKDRDEAIKKLIDGDIKILCNVNIFSTGVDIPIAEVGLMARPTKSEILYIQQLGRLLRPCRICSRCKTQYDNSESCPKCGSNTPEFIKTHATIIDFGNNTSRFGLPFDERIAVIREEDLKKLEDDEKKLVKTCRNCFMVYDARLPKCPHCEGAETKERLFRTKTGNIVPYNEYEAIKSDYYHLCFIEKTKRLKPNWKFFQLYEKHRNKVMKYSGEFDIPSWIPKIWMKSKEEKSSGKVYR